MNKSFRYAEVWNNETQQWELVDANKLTEADRRNNYRCPDCHNSVMLVINTDKDNCFRHREKPEQCDIYNSKKRIERVVTGFAFNFNKFIDPIEQEPNETGGGGKGGGGKGGGDNSKPETEPEVETQYGIKCVTSLRKILELIQHGEQANEKTDDKDVRDYIVCLNKINEIKINQPEYFDGIMLLGRGRVKMVNLPHVDYKVWLKDISSVDDENCLRVLASVVGIKDNTTYLNKIYAKEEDGSYADIKVFVIGRFHRVYYSADVITYEISLAKNAYVIYDNHQDLLELFLWSQS